MASASANASVSLPRITLTRPTSFTPVKFTPVQSTIQTPDVNILANSLKTMEQRRYTAAENMAKISTALGKIRELVHNDSETSDWLNELNENVSGGIQSLIDEGNYGQAIFQSIQTAADLLNRPDVQGRIKDNAAYEEFRKGVLSGDYSDAQKRFLLDQPGNQYRHIDIYEGETDRTAIENRAKEAEQGIRPGSAGKVIGSVTWAPSTYAIKEQDTNGFMARVLQQVGKTYGGGNSTIFYKDAAGNYTPDASQSVDGLWYYQRSTGGYEALDRNKLRSAIYNAFATNQEQDEWLRRQWEIGVWDNSKGNDNFINEFTDSHGHALSYEEYKDQVITRFANNAAYYKPGDVKYSSEAGMAAMAAAAKKGASGTESSDKSILWDYETPSGMIKVGVETAAKRLADKVERENTLRTHAQELNIPNLTGNESAQELYTLIAQDYSSKGKEIPVEVIQQYKDWKNLNEELQSEFEGDTDKKNAFEFKASLDNGVDMSGLASQGNPYAVDYMKKVVDTFKDNKGRPITKVYFPVSNSVDALRLFDNNGKTAESYGIAPYVDGAGQHYVSLDKNHSQYLYLINKALSDSGYLRMGYILPEGYNPREFRGNDYVNRQFQGTLYLDENKKFHRSDNRNWTNDFVNDIEDPYKAATKMLEDKHISTELSNDRDIPLYVSEENNLMEITARQAGLSSTIVTDASKITEQAIQSLTGADIDEFQVGTNLTNTRFRVKDPAKRAEIMSILQGILRNPQEKSRVEFHTDRHGLGTLITVAQNANPKTHYSAVLLDDVGDDKTGRISINEQDQFSIYIPNWMLSTIRDALKNQPGYEEAEKLYHDFLAGHSTPVFDCTRKLTSVDGKTYIYSNPSKNSNISLKEKDAVKLYNLSQTIDTYNTLITSKGINLESEENKPMYKNIIADIITKYADVYNLPITSNNPQEIINSWEEVSKSRGVPSGYYSNEFYELASMINSKVR